MIRKAPRTVRETQGSFAEVLGAMPALWSRLIDKHVADPTGKRCLACTISGTGTPGATWPSRIRDIAESARARYIAHRTGSGNPCRSTHRPPT